MIFQMTNYEPVLLSICQDLDIEFNIQYLRLTTVKELLNNIVNDLSDNFEKRFSQQICVYI